MSEQDEVKQPVADGTASESVGQAESEVGKEASPADKQEAVEQPSSEPGNPEGDKAAEAIADAFANPGDESAADAACEAVEELLEHAREEAEDASEGGDSVHVEAAAVVEAQAEGPSQDSLRKLDKLCELYGISYSLSVGDKLDRLCGHHGVFEGDVEQAIATICDLAGVK